MIKVDKAKKLRELLCQDKIIRVAGAHDGISAKLAEIHKFDAIWASGLCISAVQTTPDASILTMTEFLNAASIMNESCNLPVIADCDSGYGNIHNVIRMTEKYEAMGIAGVCIEDKVYPKLNSFLNTQHDLISIEEFCAKIRAVKMTQKSKDFVLIARTEALIANLGQDEAYKRAKSYAEAGADMILIHSKSKKTDEILEFVDKWDIGVPIVVVPTKYPHIKAKELENHGVKMVIYANQALRAAITAMNKLYENIIQNDSTINIEDEVCSVEEIFDLQNMDEMERVESEIYKK